VPPLVTRVGVELPPEEMISTPLLWTIAPLAEPKTGCVPPLLMTAEMSRLRTVSAPPLLMVVALAVPPENTNMLPRLTTMSLVSVWPELTL
jgi:hypothetical protein